MTGILPLEAAISLENLRAGREEWFNVQDPVRYALEVILAQLQDNGQSLRRLDASTLALEKNGQGPVAALQALERQMRDLAHSHEAHGARLTRLEARLEELSGRMGQSVRDLQEGVDAEVAGLRRHVEGRLGDVGSQVEDLDSRLRRQAELGGALEEGLAGTAGLVESLRRRMDEALPPQGGGARSAGAAAEAERAAARAEAVARQAEEQLDEMRRRLQKDLEEADRQRQRLEERLEASIESVRDKAAQSQERLEGSIDSLQEALRTNVAALAASEERSAALDRRVKGIEADLQEAVAEMQAAAKAAASARKADRGDAERREAELRRRIDQALDVADQSGAERRELADLGRRIDQALEEAKAAAAAVEARVLREAERKLEPKLDVVAQAAAREVGKLCSRVEELERGKVDRSAMNKFTGEVLDSFDSAAAALERKLGERWDADLQGLRADTEARLQGLASAHELRRVTLELEGVTNALGQIRAGVDQMQRDAQGQIPFCTHEEARAIAAELLRKQRGGDVDRDELRAAVQRASEAAAAAMAAVELEAEELNAVKQRVAAMQPKVHGMHEALYGSSPNEVMPSSSSPLKDLLGGTARSPAPALLSPRQKAAVGALRRLEAAEAHMHNIASDVASKADKAALEALAHQADANAASVEELSSETVARAEEVARSIAALSKGLAAHLQDRLTPSAVQAMIDEAAAAIDEENLRRIRAMMDHTHVVEQAERVLVQEDGSPAVIENGPLRAVKLSEGEAGQRTSELFERIARLDAVLEALQMRLEEVEGRSHRQSPGPSPGSASEVQAAAAFAGSIKRRVDMLEAARDANEQQILAISRSVELATKAAQDAVAAAGAEAKSASSKDHNDLRWEVLTDRLSTILDEKASHEEVRRALADLEERLELRIDAVATQGHSSGRQVGAAKASLESFGLQDEMEARLRSLISTKADKEAVEDMFSSCRKAIDARPSRAEVQAALKEKLDTRVFLAGSRPTIGAGPVAASTLSPNDQLASGVAPASASSAASSGLRAPMTSARAALEEQARSLF